MKRVLRQWLAGLLSVVLVFTLLPAAALAEEADGTTGQTVEQVQALIDALPDADTITADNRADVEAQLNAIDAAKLGLTVDEAAALDITRYDAAVEAIQVLDGMSGAGEPKLISEETVSYVDAKGNPLTKENVTVVDSTTTWTGTESDGWYVVKDSVTVSERITVTGQVNLILADDCNLTAEKGITVLDGNSLTIWGQSGGTGKLTATVEDEWYAGIGSDCEGDDDGHYSGTCGTITINGGIIKATGGGWTAGIGGEGAKVEINGGNVKAVGGDRGAAGIGGVSGGTKAVTITITGGTVEAHGGSDGAGIGNGTSADEEAANTTIKISGGFVTAVSCDNNPAPFPAISGNFSTEPVGNAIIYASGTISDKSNQSSWSGIIFEGSAGTVYGDQTLRSDFALTGGQSLTVGDKASLTVPSDITLTVPSGVTVTNNGTINVGTQENKNGVLNVSGLIDNKGTIEVWGTINGDDKIENNSGTGKITYHFKMDVTAPNFENAQYGYIQPQAQKITIKNTGEESATINKVEIIGSDFALNTGSTPTLEKGLSDESWTVQPKAGLGVGTYTATITVTYSGNDGTLRTATAEVTFTVSNWAAGSGTADAPYLIPDKATLEAFRNYVNAGNGSGEFFKLTENIDLAGSDSDQWTPIGDGTEKRFGGTFDGGGHTISGLYISGSSRYQGLFGYLGEGGTVKNLTVGGTVSCYMTGAGIVGMNYRGTVENCHNKCDVNITIGSCGGVAGANNGGTVTNCDNTGEIHGNYAGGITGKNYGGAVTNCYNTGEITGEAYAGGITGENEETVENCYNTGNISGESDIGGVIGWNNGGTVTNCYYLKGTAENGIGNGDGEATPKTGPEFKSGEVAWLL